MGDGTWSSVVGATHEGNCLSQVGGIRRMGDVR